MKLDQVKQEYVNLAARLGSIVYHDDTLRQQLEQNCKEQAEIKKKMSELNKQAAYLESELQKQSVAEEQKKPKEEKPHEPQEPVSGAV